MDLLFDILLEDVVICGYVCDVIVKVIILVCVGLIFFLIWIYIMKCNIGNKLNNIVNF